MFRTLGAVLLVTTAAPALAQNSAPQPVPFVDTIPAPRDIAYPGTLVLNVDATDTQRGIFEVKETIPVARSGHLALLYPKWIPGKHGPRGEIEKLAGLQFRANGKLIPWTRDPVDVFAFHLDVPAGVKKIEASFQFVSATAGNQGRIVMTPNMASVQFFSLSLYPAGYFTRRIPIQATVKYPEGWSAAAGLPSKAAGSTYTYDKTDYDTLMDSPALAGRYYKAFPLTDRVTLDAFADSPEELDAKPEQIAAHAHVVEQAVKLFGVQHYDKYHFLLSISDELGGIGVEHHRSTEIGRGLGHFTKWDENPNGRNVFPHEFTHSWDGKYRRGADLWTPDFRQPMRDSLLWVYEGQTQFWGYVLQARSGLVSKEDTLEAYAATAAAYDNRAGRQWRSVADTTNDPVITARGAKGWPSWQRSEDYYNEGLLVWMEADSIIRARTNGAKSLDDFARSFFGGRDGDYGEVTYTFDDVVKALNDVTPYDWRSFLDARINGLSARAPLKGFEANGYRLVYTDKPNKAGSKRIDDFAYSLGLSIAGGSVGGVQWGSPAFDAGMTVADEIVAVEGRAYSGDRLRSAVIAAKDGKAPIHLLVKRGDHFRELAIDYHGGLRYPHLEKIGDGEGGLDRLLAAR